MESFEELNTIQVNLINYLQTVKGRYTIFSF